MARSQLPPFLSCPLLPAVPCPMRSPPCTSPPPSGLLPMACAHLHGVPQEDAAVLARRHHQLPVRQRAQRRHAAAVAGRRHQRLSSQVPHTGGAVLASSHREAAWVWAHGHGLVATGPQTLRRRGFATTLYASMQAGAPNRRRDLSAQTTCPSTHAGSQPTQADCTHPPSHCPASVLRPASPRCVSTTARTSPVCPSSSASRRPLARSHTAPLPSPATEMTLLQSRVMAASVTCALCAPSSTCGR